MGDVLDVAEKYAGDGRFVKRAAVYNVLVRAT
jgi:hypothetical protein